MSKDRPSPPCIERSYREEKPYEESEDVKFENKRCRGFTIDAILSSCPTNTSKSWCVRGICCRVVIRLKKLCNSLAGKKRKFSRGPRIPFTGMQVQKLEEKFKQSNYLSSDEVMRLAMLLNLSETRVSKERAALVAADCVPRSRNDYLAIRISHL